jgi:uncharacterized protein (PEP-CTERM system associated)
MSISGATLMTRAVLAVLAALAVAAPARAQNPEWQPERTTPGWVFTPAFVLGGQWDSNVTVQSKGNPHFSEWAGLVNPIGEVNFNGRRTHVNAGYSGALEAYRRFSELQRFDQRVKFDVKQDLSRRLLFEGSTTYSDVPTTDRLEILQGQLPFLDIGSRVLESGARLQIKTGARSRIDTEYKFEHVRFDLAPQREFDSAVLLGGYSHQVGLNAFHDVTDRFTIGGGWDYRRANVEGGLQVFNIQTGSGSLAYRLARDTTVSGGLGVSYLSETRGTVSKWGPTFFGLVEQRAGRTSFSAQYERSFVPAYTIGGLTADQSVRVSARTPLGRSRSYVQGSLSYGRTRPVRELGLGFQLDSVSTHAAFGYRLSRWLQTEVFYLGTHQTSSALLDVDRHRVGIQFITSKPMRIQ